jgi:hypothetical protein
MEDEFKSLLISFFALSLFGCSAPRVVISPTELPTPRVVISPTQLPTPRVVISTPNLPTPSACNTEETLRWHQAYWEKFMAGQKRLEQSTIRTFQSELDSTKAIRAEYQAHPVHQCAQEMKAQMVMGMDNAIEAYTISADALMFQNADPNKIAPVFKEKLQQAVEHFKSATQEQRKLEATIGWFTPTPEK